MGFNRTLRRIWATLGVSTLAVVAMQAAVAQGVVARTVPPDDPGSRAACDKLIDVNLTTQQLVAWRCSERQFSTPITSGRPELRTPTGSYTIYLKERNVYFYSPWPPGDPNYYPPMFVAYAMEFLGGGYFLHTDPDQPASAFGPGSQDGPFATHGCVHVPIAVMVGLYAWADDGTLVLVHY
jgi:lipoprotein-anchoring transpeptidase ErfK/SrfK